MSDLKAKVYMCIGIVENEINVTKNEIENDEIKIKKDKEQLKKQELAYNEAKNNLDAWEMEISRAENKMEIEMDRELKKEFPRSTKNFNDDLIDFKDQFQKDTETCANAKKVNDQLRLDITRTKERVNKQKEKFKKLSSQLELLREQVTTMNI